VAPDIVMKGVLLGDEPFGGLDVAGVPDFRQEFPQHVFVVLGSRHRALVIFGYRASSMRSIYT
jgi:hypothetical protein